MNTNITERALIKRINRKLSKNGEAIRTEPRFRYRNGDRAYYRVDIDCNGVLERDVCLLDLGRELGALHAGETLAE